MPRGSRPRAPDVRRRLRLRPLRVGDRQRRRRHGLQGVRLQHLPGVLPLGDRPRATTAARPRRGLRGATRRPCHSSRQVGRLDVAGAVGAVPEPRRPTGCLCRPRRPLRHYRRHDRRGIVCGVRRVEPQRREPVEVGGPRPPEAAGSLVGEFHERLGGAVFLPAGALGARDEGGRRRLGPATRPCVLAGAYQVLIINLAHESACGGPRR
mmetsp:Transcript_66341/g.209713  ORF Transcript_66341/g.209713 Transcript_66341/m.209713 type:complete len:209 (+) Transcript_66341:1128-1754(+)